MFGGGGFNAHVRRRHRHERIGARARRSAAGKAPNHQQGTWAAARACPWRRSAWGSGPRAAATGPIPATAGRVRGRAAPADFRPLPWSGWRAAGSAAAASSVFVAWAARRAVGPYSLLRISYGPAAACLGRFFSEASRDLVFPQMFSSAAIIASDVVSTGARLILMPRGQLDSSSRGGRGLASAKGGGNGARAARSALFPGLPLSTRAAAKKTGFCRTPTILGTRGVVS